MLVLTRRAGESIRIGEAVRLTLQSRVRAHLTVVLRAPARLPIVDDTGARLSSTRTDRRISHYLIALIAGDWLRFGTDVFVRFGDGGPCDQATGTHGPQLRIAIDAPRTIAVHREEVYLRIAQIREAQRSAGVTDAREIPGTVPAFAPHSVMPAPSAPVASLSRVAEGCRPHHRSDCR
jgi:sRNA-binding carbon storage regulator CsrA